MQFIPFPVIAHGCATDLFVAPIFLVALSSNRIHPHIGEEWTKESLRQELIKLVLPSQEDLLELLPFPLVRLNRGRIQENPM